MSQENACGMTVFEGYFLKLVFAAVYRAALCG